MQKMEFFPSSRSWMYDRLYPGRGGLKQSFCDGIDQFVQVAMAHEDFKINGGIKCPCLKCDCRKIKSPGEVIYHLQRVGFMPNYWIWTRHGEKLPRVELGVGDNCTGASSNCVDTGYGEQIELMQDMVCDALGVNVSFEEPQYDDTDELPNETAQRFYNLLLETNKPLFEGSADSKLSMCVRLLALKSNCGATDVCLDLVTKMMLDSSPIRDGLPKSYYEAKSLVSKLGLESKRIDCCVRGCMLYYDNEFGKNDSALVECKFCGEPRYMSHTDNGKGRQKLVPRKAMFYLPIIPRLQRMFASPQTADKMTWHYENRSTSGM